ncbi:hypothetical protein Micbo1qcDRAFT_163875, partial [Microdochium bolleyi]
MTSHSCLDVGPPGADRCCPNDQYCFVTRNWTLGCCRIGNDCASAGPCPEALFFTNATVSVTKVITKTTTIGPANDPTTSISIQQIIT